VLAFEGGVDSGEVNGKDIFLARPGGGLGYLGCEGNGDREVRGGVEEGEREVEVEVECGVERGVEIG